MGIAGTMMNIVFFVLIIYLISRVARFFNETRQSLKEIDKKLAEIKADLSKRD